jgi:L-lysine exporter family protein LysE/ArgO
MFMWSPSIYWQGLGLGASLIMPIGAQNAHVIRTGVRGRHVGLTVAVCIVVDAALIALGTSGFGALAQTSPSMLLAARWGGAAFLLWYGLRCLASCLRGGAAPQEGDAAGGASASRAQALGAVLALSVLNPHVYLDTVVLLGAVGAGLADGHKTSFAAGAMTASLLWISALALAARRCAPVLGRPGVWRAVEALTGTTMLVLAALLAFGG